MSALRDESGRFLCILYIPPNAQRIVGFYERTPGPLGQGVDFEGKGWADSDWKARYIDYRLDDTHLQIAADLFVHKTIKDEIRKLSVDAQS